MSILLAHRLEINAPSEGDIVGKGKKPDPRNRGNISLVQTGLDVGVRQTTLEFVNIPPYIKQTQTTP